MPRRKRRQEIHFPTQDSELTDQQIDELSGAGKSENETAADISKDAKKKKEVLTAVKEIPEIFSPESVVFVIECYCMLLCFMYSFLLKADYGVIYDELKMDDDFKEKLSKPLAKLLSKYAPSEWAGMTAEIEVVMSLGMWTVASFPRARNAVAEDKKKKEMEEKKKQQQERQRTAVNV